MSHQLTDHEKADIREIVRNNPVLHNLLVMPESADALCSFLRNLYLPDRGAPMPYLTDAQKATIEELTTDCSGINIGSQVAGINEKAFKTYMAGAHDD